MVQQAAIPMSDARAVSGASPQAVDTRLPLIVTLFIIALVTPMIVNVGTVRLSAYRVLLLIFFFPSLYLLFSGKVGKVRTPDYCVMLICLWYCLSVIYHYGVAEMVQPMGIFIIECLGAYMIGRCFIRTPEAYYKTVRLLFWLVILVTPFAFYEAVTGQNTILKIFDSLGTTYTDVYKDRRMGLDRVQGPFAHPIHFGVFFGALVSVTYYVIGYGRSWFGKVFFTIWTVAVGALALSSGPLAALTAQAMFILWDVIFQRVKKRWYILTGLALLAYVLVDSLSNRNPFQVFISYLAFNEFTAYNRILIFEWGTKNIFDNPIFGIGFENWERLSWMTPSFDMFWLLPAMQHGAIMLVLYFTLFFWFFLKAAHAKIENPRVSAYRVAYVSTLFGVFMSGWTVHYWDATFVFFIFLMSSGMWIIDLPARTDGDAALAEVAPEPQGVRYSRFARKPHVPVKVPLARPQQALQSVRTGEGEIRSAIERDQPSRRSSIIRSIKR